jgi:ribosomal protein S18 acetylase RimI-like enzyme
MVDVLATGSLTIRPMRGEEVAPLAEAIVEMSEAQMANRWRERELGYRELLVADLDGQLVGTVSLYESDRPKNSIHLFALEVGPVWRRQGIGSALVQYVIDEARRRGRVRVYLEVRTDNPARRIYHRLGFRRVGHAFINAWYRFGVDGSQDRVEELSYLMVKRISSNRQQAPSNR